MRNVARAALLALCAAVSTGVDAPTKPVAPPLTLQLSVKNADLTQGDFLRLKIEATNTTTYPIAFHPSTILQVRSGNAAAVDEGSVSLVDDSFLARSVLVLPGRQVGLWGSADTWWTSKNLEMSWDQGWYELRYCTSIVDKTFCSNEVKIYVDEP